MAIPVDTVWEVNTTGSDTAAGGGFSTAQKGATGTDLTYPTPTVTTFTSNLSAVGTTTLTCSSALFLNTMLGNVIQISGQGFYCIQGFTSTTIVTVDRALGTFATTSGWVGGALASIGQAAAIATVSGNKVYIKSGAYTITSASTNISGGCAAFALANGVIEGYQTTRGDLGTAPVFTASGIATATLIANSSNDSAMRNLSVNGASLTAIRGISVARGTHYKLTANNCTNSGIFASATGTLINSAATGCTTAGFGINGLTSCVACEAWSNTVGGISAQNCIFCLSYANSGSSSDGITITSQNTMIVNCAAYSNGRDGFRSSNGSGGVVAVFQNCIAEGNGVSSGAGWGFNNATNTYINLINCAAFGNQSGAVNGLTGNLGFNISFVTGTASFFVNPGSGNFALNTTAGGGAAARAAGFPGAFPAGTTTGYHDIGAAQHADPVKLLTTMGMTGGME